ncbi:histidine-rich glycoprotein-like [Argiope bruennichi]|uniref:histidine-rich glycoprotein-like n=1 Tax=Argiope bruennichi TaxID=94029 RepID=UPI002494EFB1|nr:histidine-rich glycoprotein-like [Argiope bruennichi]
MKALGVLLLFALVACCAAIIPISIHLGHSHRYAPSYGHGHYGHGYAVRSHHYYPSYGYGHHGYGHDHYGHHGYGHSPALTIGFGKR